MGSIRDVDRRTLLKNVHYVARVPVRINIFKNKTFGRNGTCEI